MTDAATGPDAAMEKTTAPVIVMVRPPVIRQFCGDEGDCSVFEDFRADIQQAWQDRPDFSEARKLDFLMQHVGPTVRQEIACMDSITRGKAQSVLEALEKAFGEQRCPTVLLLQLLQTSQRVGETIRRYSCRLKTTYDTLVARERVLKDDCTPESRLLDRFIGGLVDRPLRNMLRELVLNSPVKLSFAEVRKRALIWDRDQEVGDCLTVNSISDSSSVNQVPVPVADAVAASVVKSQVPPPPATPVPEGMSSLLSTLLSKMDQLFNTLHSGNCTHQW